MKYISEIEINKPVNEVIELFDNPANMTKWMKGLQSFELLSGKQGEVGAKARLIVKNGQREIEMIETITVKNLPHEYSGTYEAKGVFNRVKNKFVAISDNKTLYISEQEFQFSGFLKIIGLLMPGAFKKQTAAHLVAFKNFAEKS